MPRSAAHDHQLRQWLAELDRPARPALATVSCARCRHYVPDSINPAAGAGRCAPRGHHFPIDLHCRHYEVNA
ncbi:hypothetical protein ACO2Q2_13270 [Dyella sp. KRB-257]|uniref:hypothetical protein n=1 Tax=Dyella sp. KRB-257 TaxID=3400915 RepID=UPI003C10C06C